MNSKSASITLFFLFLIIAGSGCYYDKEELLYHNTGTDCSAINAKFSDVNAIIATRCATAGCHNSTSAAGGVVLETYTQIKGKADRINQRTVLEKTMPAGMPLPGSQIAIIKCWIDSGTPN